MHVSQQTLTTQPDRLDHLVKLALAAHVLACASGEHDRSVNDAIRAATPALASLDVQEAAHVNEAVAFILCQQDPSATLLELVRESLPTLNPVSDAA